MSLAQLPVCLFHEIGVVKIGVTGDIDNLVAVLVGLVCQLLFGISDKHRFPLCRYTFDNRTRYRQNSVFDNRGKTLFAGLTCGFVFGCLCCCCCSHGKSPLKKFAYSTQHGAGCLLSFYRANILYHCRKYTTHCMVCQVFSQK